MPRLKGDIRQLAMVHPPDYQIISEQEIRREKEKARRLRQSGWWMRKIQNGICYYCHQNVGRTNLTMDHVLPLSRGGKSRKGNLVAACKACNNKKKYLLPIEWEEFLKSLSERSQTL
jgi:5-methylcytosine-specific restriction enzyme A